MTKSDAQLQKDVMEELAWDPSVGRHEIGVACDDGVVTLGGQVDNVAKKDAAMRAAERVSGVRAVADEVTVRISSALGQTDVDIAHAVAQVLEWNVQVPTGKVTARVDKGWVWLDGEVDWDFQRTAAERSVRYITGVTGISNRIHIRKLVFAPDVKQRIESALKRVAALDAAHINVQAHDGRIVLRGKVHSWAARTDAERAAWSAPGVVAVEDEIIVSA
jgi:osmotically-inducible protein OsmY